MFLFGDSVSPLCKQRNLIFQIPYLRSVIQQFDTWVLLQLLSAHDTGDATSLKNQGLKLYTLFPRSHPFCILQVSKTSESLQLFNTSESRVNRAI